ncbi:MAG: type II toxin-antitoxin system VapB family antitoxin [Steroidobacteraceae bacterium]
MKTHIDLDERLLKEAMRRGRHETKRAAVNAALAAYVNLRKRQELLALRGQVKWEGDLRKLRASRLPPG